MPGGSAHGGAVGAPVTATGHNRPPAVLGVEAFAPHASSASARRAAAKPALGGLLPAGVLPNTGSGAGTVLLLVGGLASLTLGALLLVARRRSARA